MSLDNAFESVDAHYKNIVMHQTWGHLFPDKPQYVGKIRIARGIYPFSSNCIIDEQNLPESSPWWFDAITEFASSITNQMDYGEISEFDIKVDIIQCVKELEDGEPPEEWSEIHIKQLNKKVIRKGWNNI